MVEIQFLKQLPRLIWGVLRASVDRKHRLKHSNEFLDARMVMPDDICEDKLSDLVLDCADNSQFSALEIADAVFVLAASGIGPTIEETGAVLPNAVMLAEAAYTDPKTAADRLTSIMSLYDIGPGGAYRVEGAAIRITHDGNLTGEIALDIMVRLGPRARHIGKTLHEFEQDIIDASDATDGLLDEERITETLKRQYDAELKRQTD